jgi:FkbM family methyltransferase
MEHHAAFQRFQVRGANVPADCVQDSFLGTVRRTGILNVEGYSDPDFRSYPPFDDEYYEWIDLLESVSQARDLFTFMELGAGFGRWSIRAGMAALQCDSVTVHLVSVEPEHTHFMWMQEHFALNGFCPDEHELIEAAVNDRGGHVSFQVAGATELSKPEKWYGQTIVSSTKATARKLLGAVHSKGVPSWNVATVRALSLGDILGVCGRVDLADLDLQGAELKVLDAAIEPVNAQIRKLHIGTHGGSIEAGLRSLMSTNRWECLSDWPGGRTNETPYGPIQFGDGVQTWLNPRLT